MNDAITANIEPYSIDMISQINQYLFKWIITDQQAFSIAENRFSTVLINNTTVFTFIKTVCRIKYFKLYYEV